MGSFWQSNSCVPTWAKFTESWFYSYPPRLLETHPQLKSFRIAYTMRKATDDDILQLPEFWERWFSTPKVRCVVPLQHVKKKALREWDIYVCVNQGEVIGTIVRRWVMNLHMREVVWPKAGIVDYYCIHPAYRKKGIGRSLLALLHNTTERPMPPHLILWEGFQAQIPPICAGLYMSKRCVPQGESCVKRVFEFRPEGDLCSEYIDSDETSVWISSGSASAKASASGDAEKVVVWNTFNRSIPDGAVIGIVMAGSVDAVNRFSSSAGHPFGVLLMPGLNIALDGWTIDSPFQWIAYNTQTGFISAKFPTLFL
jgi:N-acetylglutamate synthase-like GNAT family acetyltransferase